MTVYVKFIFRDNKMTPKIDRQKPDKGLYYTSNGQWHGLDEASCEELLILMNYYYSNSTIYTQAQSQQAFKQYAEVLDSKASVNARTQLSEAQTELMSLINEALSDVSNHSQALALNYIMEQISNPKLDKILKGHIKTVENIPVLIGCNLEEKFQSIISLKSTCTNNKTKKTISNSQVITEQECIKHVEPSPIFEQIKSRLHQSVTNNIAVAIQGVWDKNPKQVVLQKHQQIIKLLGKLQMNVQYYLKVIPHMSSMSFAEYCAANTRYSVYSSNPIIQLIQKIYAKVLYFSRACLFNITLKIPLPTFSQWIVRLLYDKEKYLKHESRFLIQALVKAGNSLLER